ncbi:hypothetical protein Pla111_08690 [Botrimarina hoheduenensis]|uniref:Uncharacterized protein n=1 Tax=Botrimarina hoheduenensis TaxID=2528000 RepID=A0A5C5W9T6_9BACT|nr:hypothetical protein Pla111_08690 [Botrimarina hoheduenensis]
MSQLDSSSANFGSTRSGLVKKPPMSVYTVLMIIATVALTIGCVFLYLEFSSYQ